MSSIREYQSKLEARKTASKSQMVKSSKRTLKYTGHMRRIKAKMEKHSVIEAMPAGNETVNILQPQSTARAKGTTERSDLVTLNNRNSAARRSSQSNGR